MKLVFAGTPVFAAQALARLQKAGHQIALVLSQPDRPAGRGQKPQASPVKQWAQSHGIAVAQPRSLRLDGAYAAEAEAARVQLEALDADAMVVAAYGLLLPPWALALPRLGCLNIHASLLPRWRGAAPIQRAIEAGDTETGISIMQMDAGLDTGDLLLCQALPISPSDSAASLHDKLAQLGADLIVRVLDQMQSQPGSSATDTASPLRPQPQPSEGVTYARKIDKAEAAVDWSQNAAQIERRIRAFDPFPGATAVLGGETLKLWRAEVDSEMAAPDLPPGTVLPMTSTLTSTPTSAPTLTSASPALRVVCGQGVLRLTELQRAGGKRLPAAAFLRGFALPTPLPTPLPTEQPPG